LKEAFVQRHIASHCEQGVARTESGGNGDLTQLMKSIPP